MDKECMKKKFHEEQQRHKRHAGHFADDDHVQNFRLFMVEFDENVEANIWYVDLGASTHMTGNRKWFEYFKEINNGAQIYLGDDIGYQVKGYRNILVILSDGNIIHIQNV